MTALERKMKMTCVPIPSFTLPCVDCFALFELKISFALFRLMPNTNTPLMIGNFCYQPQGDVEIVDGEDDGSIYTVEELEKMLGPEFTRDKLVSIVADMDFAVTKNISGVYDHDIIEAELQRAAANSVTDIDFSRKTIDEIPVTLGLVTKLTKLCLNDCRIKVLPAEPLKALTVLRSVELRSNLLPHFPVAFSLPSVEVLLLDHNLIVSIDENALLPMTKLRILSLFGNKLKSFPLCVTTMKTLVKLDLECNYIKTLEFDDTNLPPNFQLSIDPTVKTPSTPGKKTNARGAKKANGVTSPKASPSKAAPKKSPARSPTAKRTTAANKKRKSMSDTDLGFEVAQEDGDISPEEQPPKAKRSKAQ